MANVRNLKKDINYVIGDIINAIYLREMLTSGKPTPQTDALVDEAVATFDALIARVNEKNIENKKTHFKQISKDLETAAIALVEKVNAL